MLIKIAYANAMIKNKQNYKKLIQSKFEFNRNERKEKKQSSQFLWITFDYSS